MLEKIYKLPTDTEGTFHSEVYYINLATVMGIKWGTDSKVRMFDPSSGMHVELGACGEFNIRVINSRKLLAKLVGTGGVLKQEQLIGMGDGKGYFRGMIMTQVKSYLAQAIKSANISILEIDERLMDLSSELRERLNGFLADYGLEMPEFFVTRVMTPDDDPNFRRMKEQYAQQFLLVRQEQIRKQEAEAAAARKEVEAATAARMKIISAQGDAEALRAKAQAEADAYRMQAEAEALEMKMKGYTYQQETARQVGMEAMKNGISGGVGAGALGDLAGLGISLGAMGSVIGMTKDALHPAAETAKDLGQMVGASIADNAGWDCDCGQKGNKGNFCMNCGARKPQPQAPSDTWDCECGAKGNTGKFCPNCGAKRLEINTGWDCTCGQKNNTGKFCANCGKKREE